MSWSIFVHIVAGVAIVVVVIVGGGGEVFSKHVVAVRRSVGGRFVGGLLSCMLMLYRLM